VLVALTLCAGEVDMYRRAKLNILRAMLVVLLMSEYAAFAEQRLVPSQYPDIQAAIDK